MFLNQEKVPFSSWGLPTRGNPSIFPFCSSLSVSGEQPLVLLALPYKAECRKISLSSVKRLSLFRNGGNFWEPLLCHHAGFLFLLFFKLNQHSFKPKISNSSLTLAGVRGRRPAMTDQDDDPKGLALILGTDIKISFRTISSSSS